MSQLPRSWCLCKALQMHFCWCSSFLSSHIKSIMSSLNTVEVIILSTNCPTVLRTRWSGLVGAMVSLLWSTLFLMLVRFFLAVTKYWQDQVRKSLYLHSWFQHIVEWHSVTYNMRAGGNRVSHNWKWPKQDAAPHNFLPYNLHPHTGFLLEVSSPPILVLLSKYQVFTTRFCEIHFISCLKYTMHLSHICVMQLFNFAIIILLNVFCPPKISSCSRFVSIYASDS